MDSTVPKPEELVAKELATLRRSGEVWPARLFRKI
jgi:hypothetical protein